MPIEVEFDPDSEGVHPFVVCTDEAGTSVEIIVAAFKCSADAREYAEVYDEEPDIEETVVRSNGDAYWNMHALSRKFDTAAEADAFVERVRESIGAPKEGHA